MAERQEFSTAAITVDGVRAVELYFRPVRRISGGRTAFFQSQMRLNTPRLGTLLPESYLAVAESAGQSEALFRLGLLQILRMFQTMRERGSALPQVSLYMPVSFLRTEQPAAMIVKMCDHFGVEPELLCFECSCDLLFESDGIAAAAAVSIAEASCRFLLTGFGAAGCPVLGLAQFSMDYVMLDPSLGLAAGRGEREKACVRIMAELAAQLGAELIAPAADREQDRLFGELGCVYSVSGAFMHKKYAFKKKAVK